MLSGRYRAGTISPVHLVSPLARYRIRKTPKRVAGIEAERSLPAEARHLTKRRSKIKAVSKMVGAVALCALIVVKDNESAYPARYTSREDEQLQQKLTR